VFRLPPLTPVVRAQLIALVVIFVLAAILQNFVGISMIGLFALETRALSVLTPLQLFTHAFIVNPDPNAIFWLALSGYFMWLILAPFEQRYGARRTIELTIVSAVSAGVPALAAGLLLPRMAAPLAGPQTITLAAICAYAVLLPPYAEVSFFGWMLKPKHLLLVVLGFSVIGFLTSVNLTALAADLGAIGGGMAFVRYWMQRPPPRRGSKQSKSPRLRVVDGGREEDPAPGRWLN
jgi:membrane associated rhomboid family serine protease